MGSFNINLAQMAQETFEYQESLSVNQSDEISPGLIYYLEKGANTFSIKGFATVNIEEKKQNLQILMKIVILKKFYQVKKQYLRFYLLKQILLSWQKFSKIR